MDEKNWQNVKEIFLAALEKDAEKRTVFLNEVCGDDANLKSEVESLLASHEEVEEFIETPVFQVGEVFTNGANPQEKRLGNYKIIKEIGAGGMGVVYLAAREDEQFRKRVAIKLVKRGLDTEDVLRRFRNERQILASLHHSNIASLLDGGTSDDGLPYFVMEYIEGSPLLQYCAEHQLSINERLDLFKTICSAVQHAHQNLVIHRDLKPSNILITHDGEVKLLDFGVAKFLNPELMGDNLSQTQTQFRVMTPEYASPEQVRGGHITTATDIYSLGVILYELLTGSRPFKLKDTSPEEMARLICDSEPTMPSAISNFKFQISNSEEKSDSNRKSQIANCKLLKGDLDNIILTALRKEPSRRYKSVEAFANYIDRYLKGLPVTARPNTFKYRASKFIKRHSVGVLAAGLVLLSLIGGLAAFAWQAKVAAAQRDRAEKRFDDVRKLSASLLFEISPQIERLPGSTLERQTIVRRALEYLDSLAAEAAGNESLQSELATAYEQVGDVQGKPGKANLGDLKGATESYLKAQKIRFALAEKDAGNFELQKFLAANYYAVGELQWWSGKIEGALENYRAALQIYESLSARQPENLTVNRAVVQTNLGIATALSFNSERKKSTPIFRQMIVRLEELKAKNPTEIDLMRLSENAHIDLAYDLSWEDQMDEAAVEVKKAVEIGEPLLAANPNDTEIRRALWLTYFLAGGIFEDADFARSRSFLEKSVKLAQQTIAMDEVDFQAKHDLAQSYSKLSVIAVSEKKYDEAILLLGKSREVLQKLTDAEPRHAGYQLNLANNLTRLGDAQQGKGNLPEALASYQQAAALHEKMREADADDNLNVRNLGNVNWQIGETYQKMNRCETAAGFYRKGLAMFDLLKQKNAFDEYDKKTVENVENSLADCQKDNKILTK